MTATINTRMENRIPIARLAEALGRTDMFLRSSLMMLKLPVHAETLALEDAVAVTRHLAQRQSDQEELLATLIAKITSAEKRELEFAVALEMVKQERAALKRYSRRLEEALEREQTRGDRLEQNLTDLTMSFVHIVSQRDRLVARSKLRSKATLIERNGRSVLYLEEPVNLHLLEKTMP